MRVLLPMRVCNVVAYEGALVCRIRGSLWESKSERHVHTDAASPEHEANLALDETLVKSIDNALSVENVAWHLYIQISLCVHMTNDAPSESRRMFVEACQGECAQIPR